jgi:hypothetical protein
MLTAEAQAPTPAHCPVPGVGVVPGLLEVGVDPDPMFFRTFSHLLLGKLRRGVR